MVEKYLKRKIDNYLIQWKNDRDRKPLIVKGARQIGKTESICRFANENYKNVNAEIEEKNSDSVLNWYRKLVNLRAGHAELIGGDYKLLLPDNEKIFAFSRSLNGKTLITAVNFVNEKIALPPDFIDKKILLDSESGADKNILKSFEVRILKG